MEIPVDLADEGHFHDCAVDYAKKVNDMTGGRLTAPSFGWDSHGLLGWFYHGGGEALYNELVNEILKVNTASAAFSATADQFGFAQGRYADDLAEIRNRGVQILKTPDSLLEAQLAAWDRVIAAQSDPFFKKVIESQKAWARRTVPYFLINNNNTAALQAAYTDFFG